MCAVLRPRWLYRLFMMIAEPRHIRLMQFFVYLSMMAVGFGVFERTPRSLESVVGSFQVDLFGGFLILGSLLGAVAVLPGIWWLERIGIVALWTAFLMFLVMVLYLGPSLSASALSVLLIFVFVQRWMEISGSKLAPRED